MEWPAPPSGVVGSPANQEEEGMDISVLGIDLGKNVSSTVMTTGLNSAGNGRNLKGRGLRIDADH